MEKCKTVFQEILRIKDEINAIVYRMSGDIVVFERTSLREPRLVEPIHGFYTTISWLYVWYYEGAKTNIDFLTERAGSLMLDSDGHLKRHRETVHAFRTYLQHSINLDKATDLGIQARCHRWAVIHICIDEPETEEHWQLCLGVLLGEAKKFFNILLQVVKEMCNDNAWNETLVIWRTRISRHHPAHEYDSIIQVAAAEMGLPHIDAVALRKRYLQKWNGKLRILKVGYEFEYEARRMIEHTLLNEERLPMPITGADIIREFQIPPGPKVGEFLRKAEEMFRAKPCTREEVLCELRKLLNSAREAGRRRWLRLRLRSCMSLIRCLGIGGKGG